MPRYKLISALVASRRRFSMGLGVILALSAFVFSEPAAALNDPQAVVALVGTEGMATLALSPAQRDARLHELFDRYFDVDGSAEFALGRYRNMATPQQLQEFFRLYGQFTARTYGERLGQVGAAPFRVTGARLDGRGAIVNSEITRPGGNSIAVVWSLINRHGNFKINDLSVGGTSMRLAQREEFARWIANNGGRFDSLLIVMRQQIAQMGPPVQPGYSNPVAGAVSGQAAGAASGYAVGGPAGAAVGGAVGAATGTVMGTGNMLSPAPACPPGYAYYNGACYPAR